MIFCKDCCRMIASYSRAITQFKDLATELIGRTVTIT